MAGEPAEDEIENFISFTSTSREQAVHFLKSNDLNSNKAINAYFEDPNSFQSEVCYCREVFKGRTCLPMCYTDRK
jgi:hypothetical protein